MVRYQYLLQSPMPRQDSFTEEMNHWLTYFESDKPVQIVPSENDRVQVRVSTERDPIYQNAWFRGVKVSLPREDPEIDLGHNHRWTDRFFAYNRD